MSSAFVDVFEEGLWRGLAQGGSPIDRFRDGGLRLLTNSLQLVLADFHYGAHLGFEAGDRVEGRRVVALLLSFVGLRIPFVVPVPSACLGFYEGRPVATARAHGGAMHGTVDFERV